MPQAIVKTLRGALTAHKAYAIRGARMRPVFFGKKFYFFERSRSAIRSLAEVERGSRTVLIVLDVLSFCSSSINKKPCKISEYLLLFCGN